MIRRMIPNEFDKESTDTSFKRGLDLQREQFKDAKYRNNYDDMCDALENIKSEIKEDIIKRKANKQLLRIERIINWYRNLESNYIQNTPDGKQVVFPANLHNKVNKNLTICYEYLIVQLKHLKLL